jgi:transposase
VRYQRTSVGLDVHARSVVGCGLDGETGEVFERRLTPDHREILEWLQSLPGRPDWVRVGPVPAGG